VDARDEQGATWEILRNGGSINHDGHVGKSGKDASDFYLRSNAAIRLVGFLCSPSGGLLAVFPPA
jgi:hypothetical protein